MPSPAARPTDADRTDARPDAPLRVLDEDEPLRVLDEDEPLRVLDEHAQRAAPSPPTGDDNPVARNPDYYVDNLSAIFDAVRTHDADLLRAPETHFLDAWDALCDDARRLYARLIARKGPWFRRDRLTRDDGAPIYDEIDRLDDAIDRLQDARLLDVHAPDRRADAGSAIDPSDDDEAARARLHGWLHTLRINELTALAAAVDAPTEARRGRKAARIDALLADRPVAALERVVLERVGAMLRPGGGDALRVLRLLFFGNLGQDWTVFILRDLGIVRHADYPIVADLRPIASRDAVDDRLALHDARQLAEMLLHSGELAPAVALAQAVRDRPGGWHPSVRARVDRLLCKVGRALERARRAGLAPADALAEQANVGVLAEQAMALYAAAEAPPARERRARLLAAVERVDDALTLCDRIAEAPRDETERVFADRFAHRLRRARGEVPPRRRPKRPQRTLELPGPPEGPVESAVLEALDARDQPGVFAENGLWRALFGLAFWDIVFAPVAGAFQHPFQLGPQDLMEPGFRTARRDAIETRLAALAQEATPGPALLARYDAHEGTANALVGWYPGQRARLAFALARLHGRHLAAVCDRLSRDLGRYRRGLPDLFVARAETPGFELLEVKAPGDQLRPEQGAWIDHLNDHDLPAAVLRVRW